jgi:hypothetical protein
MAPEVQREVESLCNALEREGGPDLAAAKQQAAAAWEQDMAPVRAAIVSALEAGDLAALRGLKGLLAPLLAEVNQQPALADLLAVQLGQELLAGMQTPPEEAR